MRRSAPESKFALQIYIGAVALYGAAVLAFSLVSAWRTPQPWLWLAAGAVALIAGSFRVTFRGATANIAIDDAILIGMAMLFGPGPVTLTNALGGFIQSRRLRQSADKVVFNTTAPAIAMWCAAHVFFIAARVPPLAQNLHAVGSVVFPLIALGIAYFALNAGLTTVVVALDTGQSLWSAWRHFRWLSVSYLAAASVAFCLVLLIEQSSFTALLLVLPIFAVFHLTLRTSSGRADDARRHVAEVDRLYLSTIETLAMAIDAKDDVTHSHVRRVQAYATALARAMGVVDEPTTKAIEAAALLHDTGKLAVPEHILNKPGKLTAAEFDKMKLHADIGADILSLVQFPFPVEPIVRCHHENWDGTGYPRGVAGDDIPIGARILSVVDCFDALTSDRPYRRAMTDEAAVAILRERSGSMYDPRVVDAFVAMYHDVSIEREESPEQREVLRRISATRHADEPMAPAATPAAMTHDLLAFVSLARVATGEHTLLDALGLASTLVADIVPGATGAWYVPDEVEDRLVVVDTFGPHAASFANRSVGTGEQLTGWVAVRRQPILDSDVALDLGLVDTPLKRCMSVPLTAGESTIAVLTLYSEDASAFSGDRARLVQVVAPHLAATVQSALSRERGARRATPRKSGLLSLVSGRSTAN